MSATGAAPRPAATLLLVRDGPHGIEIFMVRRPGAADFGGLYVFPGGKVDLADAGVEPYCIGLDDATASARLGLERGGLAYWVAALREAFEEAGVLFAARDGALIESIASDAGSRYGAYRRAMQAGEMTLEELCAREGLELAVDRIHYFSHWITPPVQARRYDTRFFVAEMPPGQRLRHQRGELTDGRWVSAAEALRHHATGRWQMIAPTLSTLSTLAGFPTVAALLARVVSAGHLPEVTDELERQGMQPLLR